MKVCAHIALWPWNWEYRQFNTVREARQYFRDSIAGVDFGTGTGEQVMDLFPLCNQKSRVKCTSGMNVHDYVMTRYESGPRGGVRRTTT